MAALGGVSLLFPGLILTAIYIYFMGGLIFYHALAANVIVILAYLAAGSALQLPVREFGYDTLSIVAVNLFCASVVYMHEKTSRMRFLEAALLREMVARDGLTGIQNRRMFDQHIQRVWSRRYARPSAWPSCWSTSIASRITTTATDIRRRRMPASGRRILEPMRAPAFGFRRPIRR